MPDALVVDRQGLARKLANRPKAFVLYELLQNAYDENTTNVKVTTEMLPGRPVCRIIVEDDSPEGFQDLRSIYTLFRDSKKAGDPTKRGRFELGEKLIAAIALRMEVATTKGTIVFEGNERQHLRTKTASGSRVLVEIKMTREEYAEMMRGVMRVFPAVPTSINGEALPVRKHLTSFEATLQTIRADEEGNLRPTARKTTVNILEPHKDEPAMIYEMGIPIMETGDDKYHYDVQQRVPMNWERDSVPPSYLTALRAFALNAVHDHIRPEETTAAWVRDASADERCEKEAFEDIMDKRFGENRVVRDPNDPESASRAMAHGFEVIGGRTLSGGEWNNAKRFNAIPSSGSLFATHKPYSTDPNAPEVTIIGPSEYTAGMRQIVEYGEYIGRKLLGTMITVEIVRSKNYFAGAFVHPAEIHLNLFRLGHAWFDNGITEDVLSLFIHELAHRHEDNHLSDRYIKEVCRLAGKLTKMIVENEELRRLTR